MGLLFSKTKNDSNRLIVFVEGNIGSGKSTLLDHLDALGYKVYREFPDLFSAEYKVGDNEKNIIEMFYENKEKYSYALQFASLNSRTQSINSAIVDLDLSQNNGREIVFVERSILTDFMVFEPTLHEEGFIDFAQHCIYQDLIETHLQHLGDRMMFCRSIFAYLGASPELCLDRIKERGRDGEDSIKVEYLKRLHDKHESWLQGDKDAETYIYLDASQSVDQISKDLLDAINDLNED